MNNAEDEIPIPSLPILSEEESSKQIQAMLTKPLRDQIESLTQQLAEVTRQRDELKRGVFLSDEQWTLVLIALSKQAFREAEIAVDLRFDNTLGPRFASTKEQIETQIKNRTYKNDGGWGLADHKAQITTLESENGRLREAIKLIYNNQSAEDHDIHGRLVGFAFMCESLIDKKLRAALTTPTAERTDGERVNHLEEGLLLGSDGRITAPNIESLLDSDLSNGVRPAIDADINAKKGQV